MAHDFNGLLEGLGGEGEDYINSLDADGVALAAIQGLYGLAQEQAAGLDGLEKEYSALRAENAVLQQQLGELEARLTALEQGSGSRAAPRRGLVAGSWLLVGLAVVAGVGFQRRRTGGQP
jgi:hypothetical protein